MILLRQEIVTYRNQMRTCSKRLLSSRVNSSEPTAEVIMVGIRSWMFSWELVAAKQGIGVLTGNRQSTDFGKVSSSLCFRDIHEIPYQELWENTRQ